MRIDRHLYGDEVCRRRIRVQPQSREAVGELHFAAFVVLDAARDDERLRKRRR